MGDVTLIVAQSAGEPSLFGWYLGLAIGLVIVVVVVVIVAAILSSAARINRQARDATAALDASYRNTIPLWDVARTNQSLARIVEQARAARIALGG